MPFQVSKYPWDLNWDLDLALDILFLLSPLSKAVFSPSPRAEQKSLVPFALLPESHFLPRDFMNVDRRCGGAVSSIIWAYF